MSASTKIAVGFVVLVAIIFGGYHFATGWMIGGKKFEPIEPGRVTLLGVAPGSGYRIIVANQIAQLVEVGDGGFAAPGGGDAGPTEGAIKKRLPMREMLQSLRGDEEALGRFLMILNEMGEGRGDYSPNAPVWKAEDLRKALDGDAEYEARLVKDLNVHLDGSPREEISKFSLENGILIDAPVPVRVLLGDEERTMIGRVKMPYRPQFIQRVEAQYREKFATDAMIAGHYVEEARRVLDDPNLKEDVRRTIESRIDEKYLARLAGPAEHILQRAHVIVNDSLIESATTRKTEGPDGKPLIDLRVRLTEEGRQRLWQYSRNRIGTQLLLVVDGVAIAAPRVEHQLAQRDVTITQLPDPILVEDAVNIMNKTGKDTRL
jgi:hypothetical protein